MKYKELSIGRKITFRYSGWDKCFNILPYCVIRANPRYTDWKDFSIECGWLIWAAGVRFDLELRANN